MNESVLIEMLGFIGVFLMMVFYALENRNVYFVLAFACSCLIAATYAFLIASWPFAIVEVVWSLVAFYRFYQLKNVKQPSSG